MMAERPWLFAAHCERKEGRVGHCAEDAQRRVKRRPHVAYLLELAPHARLLQPALVVDRLEASLCARGLVGVLEQVEDGLGSQHARFHGIVCALYLRYVHEARTTSYIETKPKPNV